MTEKRRPWSKWYWGDWRKDVRLHRCSYAARGLWADMLSLMGGECDHFGYLILEGAPLEPADLTGLVGGSDKEIKKLIAELEAKGVFSRVGGDMPDDVKALIIDEIPEGTIISRRMLRDKAKEEKDRENGKGGGNPKLRQNDDDRLSQKSTEGLTQGDKAQKLEARNQKPESPPLPPANVSRETTSAPSLERRIIKAFDDARAAKWGENQRRMYPDSRDGMHAQRWIADGADLELCAAVFDVGMKNWRGPKLPGHLGVFTSEIGEALVNRRAAQESRDFDADDARVMQQRIRELIAAGYSEAEVKGLGLIHKLTEAEFQAKLAEKKRPVRQAQPEQTAVPA